jgi:solute carrier family 13 (sodium-dependent dicarboxylate transporter), member 2/3/5
MTSEPAEPTPPQNRPSPSEAVVAATADAEAHAETGPRDLRLRIAALLAGPLFGGLVAWSTSSSIGFHGAATLGLLVWMAVWWLTIATDLAATALLPALLLPTLGISTPAQAMGPYADGIIFLFAGGFSLAIALERHGLSDRFASAVLALAGTHATRVIGALMIVTALLSAFVSNTATAAAMLPIAIALGHSGVRVGQRSATAEECATLRTSAVLAVAYAASIGGVMTLVGSPPNAIAARAIGQYQDQLRAAAGESGSATAVSFAEWLRFGGPIGLIFLILAWYLLTRWSFRLGGFTVEPITRAETTRSSNAMRLTAVIFGLTVVGWLTRPLFPTWASGVRDETIAVGALLLLLTLPARLRPFEPLLPITEIRRLPWGVLILFGGGLSIAAAVEQHGVATWLAGFAGGLADAPPWILIAVIAVVACFATEIASNTALTATIMPVLAALATASSAPMDRLAITGAIAASFAFMLPVATPPNAMAYATGEVTVGQMARTGLLLNIIGIAVIIAVMTLTLPSLG